MSNRIEGFQPKEPQRGVKGAYILAVLALPYIFADYHPEKKEDANGITLFTRRQQIGHGLITSKIKLFSNGKLINLVYDVTTSADESRGY